MRITLDEILSDFHGQSVSGGGLSHEHAEEPTMKASSISDRILPVATFVLGALLASVCAAEFYGEVRIECGRTNVVWRNVPAHVFVQGTLDATNWFDLTEHRTIDGSPLGSFSFRIPTQDTNAFYRLRTP